MRFDIIQLANKLRCILLFSFDYKNQERDLNSFAQAIAGEKFDEFVYFYRGSENQIRKGYTTATKIEIYIKFLQYCGYLNKELIPIIDRSSVEEKNEIFNKFSTEAKERLRKKGIGVKDISQASVKILKSGNGILPTIAKVHEEMGPDLSKWLFCNLVKLYTLSETSLIDFKTRSLILPRKYLD